MFIVVAFALHTIGFYTSHMMETVRVDGFQNSNNWPTTQKLPEQFFPDSWIDFRRIWTATYTGTILHQSL